MSIIVIAGPTGVGKTKLSIELAKRVNGEIINADSMQVYKGLDIGTAKVSDEEKEGILHHLFDIVNVGEIYTIYDYQRDCRSIISNIISRGKTPIIVGGSGLYIRAALFDYKLDFENKKNDYSMLSNQELLDKCLSIDKTCNIHINNRKRLERFLDINLNNKSIVNDSKPIYDFKMIGLTTDRENLYNIIDNRVDKMINEGLLDEVKSFYDKDIRSKAIMTGIGYKELYSYFDGKISLDDAIDLIKKNSRHLAKRQYTFFNNQFDNIKWFEVNFKDFSKTINEVVNYIEG